jgi:hypothetical protein
MTSPMDRQRSSSLRNAPASAYVRSRNDSVFEIVEPPAIIGAPSRPPRPASLVLDEMLPPSPASPSQGTPRPDLEQERALRRDLLDRLASNLGQAVMLEVDVHAIEHIDQPIPSPVAPSPVPDLARNGSGTSGSAPAKRKSFFGRRRSKKKSTSMPESSLEKIAEEARFKQEVFGVALSRLPAAASCMSIIGGQHHVIPIWAFSLVEEMYRRGGWPPATYGSHVQCRPRKAFALPSHGLPGPYTKPG